MDGAEREYVHIQLQVFPPPVLSPCAASGDADTDHSSGCPAALTVISFAHMPIIYTDHTDTPLPRRKVSAAKTFDCSCCAIKAPASTSLRTYLPPYHGCR